MMVFGKKFAKGQCRKLLAEKVGAFHYKKKEVQVLKKLGFVFLGYLFILWVFIATFGYNTCLAIDWNTLASDLVDNFKPKIISIEKLDEKSCWAVLLPDTTESDAMQISIKIGEYINGKIPPETTPKPMVRSFVGGKQVAIGIPDGATYRAEKRFENMDPTTFKGQYRPKQDGQ